MVDYKVRIIEKLIIKEQHLHFDKRGCQLDSALLDLASDEIINKIKENRKTPESICALGTSGLALGIFLSLKLSLPIYFYCSEGFPEIANHKIHYIFPMIDFKKSTILVDSHPRTTNTWGACENHIKKYNLLDPLAIIFLFNPDTNELRKDSTLPVLEVIKASEYSKEIIGTKEKFSLYELLKPSSNFWDEPTQESDLVERETQYFSRVLLELEKKGEKLDIKRISPNQELLAQISNIPITDPGIWNIFLEPKLVKSICEEIILKYDFRNIGYLIGISYLGSAFAHSLSYFLNKNGLNVKVFNSYDSQSLLPVQKKYFTDKKDILLCQVRFLTGLTAYRTLLKIKFQDCNNRIDLLCIKTNLSIENERRKRPLYQLKKSGLSNFYTFSLEN